MGEGFKLDAVNLLKAVISPMKPMNTPSLALMEVNFTLQLTLPDPCCSEHNFVSRLSLLPFPLSAHIGKTRGESLGTGMLRTFGLPMLHFVLKAQMLLLDS